MDRITNPKFECVKCGKAHPCPWITPTPKPLEEREKLRAAMNKAIDLWDLNPGVASYERKVEVTEMAYYSSLGGAEGWGFPETMTTSKDGNSGWYAHCKECTP